MGRLRSTASAVTFCPSLCRGRSAGRRRPGVRRAGLDGSGAALLRGDERLDAAGCRPSALARDRRRALPDRRARGHRPRNRPRLVAPTDRPHRRPLAERLRHHRGHRLVLRAGVQPDRRGRCRHAHRDRADLRGPPLGAAPGRAGRAAALGRAGPHLRRHRRPAPAGLRHRLAGGAGGDPGSTLLCDGHDLAPPHRPRREPRGGGPALLAHRARHHAAPQSAGLALARCARDALPARRRAGRGRRPARHDPRLRPPAGRAGDRAREPRDRVHLPSGPAALSRASHRLAGGGVAARHPRHRGDIFPA